MANIIKKENGHQPASFGNVVDQIFQNNLSRFFDDSFWGFNGLKEQRQVPVNIRESDNNYEIEMVIPGIQKEKLTIEAGNDMITVSYQNTEEKKEKKDNYIQQEYRHQAFSRNFRLNDTVDAGNITAKYEDGILRLSLPKNEKSKKVSRTIAIQ
ncbi:Hsp20/alpha crystallin family protein [Pseudobacter ginsenosidimutans]|uniref:Heat shock protein Hsp20 n=1 Tax=Pseudobacter ginsenosidimutans TaxID=661488 RepID=A0A4Q7MUU8_9BACT|nr:Hsp20/alpha crystallin family protein [Pseudobacter ginsenosidimutans]QEC42314.1 Hsp20/alpha crystallin family protein [Pseudobacter ginsenosidimutans]RZS70840.1 heat shock protein Hsp20 [Pseudobacter ginsenosidimutans]